MFMRILISAMQIIKSCLTELFWKIKNEFVYKNHLPISRTLKTVHVNNQYMLSQIFCNVSKFSVFSLWRIENDNLSVFLKKVFLCINTCWKPKNFCNYSRGTRKLSGLIEETKNTLYIYYYWAVLFVKSLSISLYPWTSFFPLKNELKSHFSAIWNHLSIDMYFIY